MIRRAVYNSVDGGEPSFTLSLDPDEVKKAIAQYVAEATGIVVRLDDVAVCDAGAVVMLG